MTTSAERAASWYARNRELQIQRSAARNKVTKQRRREMLSIFDCISCGQSNPDVIEWHHLDPASKERNIFTGNIAEDTFWNEVLKCVPLCCNCHTLIHKNKLCLIPQVRT